MAAREWASLLAGLALAGAGLTAFAVGAPRDGIPATATTETSAVPSVAAAGSVVTTVRAAVLPGKGDLSPAVASVLARAGYLEVIDPGPAGVPLEVARVLAARGVVLRVPADPLLAPVQGLSQ